MWPGKVLHYLRRIFVSKFFVVALFFARQRCSCELQPCKKVKFNKNLSCRPFDFHDSFMSVKSGVYNQLGFGIKSVSESIAFVTYFLFLIPIACVGWKWFPLRFYCFFYYGFYFHREQPVLVDSHESGINKLADSYQGKVTKYGDLTLQP